MKGAMIDQGEPYFTHLKKIFHTISHIQKNYNWLILGHECYPQNEEYKKILAGDYCWLSGELLTEMIENEDIQWIWGILFAFDRQVSKQEVLQYDISGSAVYADLWKKPVSIYHPSAQIEIVAWDSTATIFISEQDSVIDGLKKGYPLAEDLEAYISTIQ